jgi:O-antigen/teichoic acid export membrane protein
MDDDLRKLVSKRSFFGIISQLIQLFASFIVGSLIARFLGPTLFGSYNVLISVWIISSLAFGGINPTIQYFLAKHGRSIGAFVYKWFKITLLLVFISGMIVVSIAKFLSAIYGIASFYFVIIGLGSVFLVPLSFASSVLVGLGEMKTSTKLYSIFELLRAAQVLTVIVFKDKVLGAIAGYYIAYFIASVISFSVIRRHLASGDGKPNLEEFKRIAFSNYVSSVITLIPNIRVVSLILGVVSLDFVGYFRVITLLSSLILSISAGIGSGIFSLSTHFYHTGEHKSLLAVRRSAANIIAILTVPIFVFYLFLTPEIIISLYRAAYSPVIGPLWLLSGIILFSALMYPNNLLSSIGKYQTIMYSNIIGLVVFIFAIFSVHFIGLYGAAIAYGANIFVLTLVGMYITSKHMPLIFPFKRAVLATVNSVVIALLLKYSYALWHPLPLMFIGEVLGGFFLYLLLEQLMKQIDLVELLYQLAK